MKLNVLFFGGLVDVTGVSQKELITDNVLNVKLLDEHVRSLYPILAKHKYKIAVNQKIAEGTHLLHDGAEVAFLPPFAGG